MKISDFLLASDVLPDLNGTNPPEVLAELCGPVAATGAADADALLAARHPHPAISSEADRL